MPRAVSHVVAAALVMVACGDALSPVTLSPDDAAEVYVQATLQPYLMAVGLVQTPGPVNASTNCASSGTLGITGTVSSSSVALSARFTACKAERYQMDGTITIEGTLTQTVADLNWHGTLVLDGPAQGECWVDIVLTVNGAGETLSGTVCGADAAPLPDAAKRAGLLG